MKGEEIPRQKGFLFFFVRRARGDGCVPSTSTLAARRGGLTGLDEDLHLGCFVRGSGEFRRRSEKEGSSAGRWVGFVSSFILVFLLRRRAGKPATRWEWESASGGGVGESRGVKKKPLALHLPSNLLYLYFRKY